MKKLDFEKKLFKQGYKYIAGVDEVGRGPLAGPVVSACVVVDRRFLKDINNLQNLNDSKKTSEKNRDKIFAEIRNNAISVGIGVVNEKTIDRINILQASLLSSKKAILSVKQKPDIVLVDGKYKIPDLDLNQEAIIQGDAKVAIIALASIIAKVYRDKLMTKLSTKYPGYNFNKNKGYGTLEHREKIKELGPCGVHRLSFAPLKDLNKKY